MLKLITSVITLIMVTILLSCNLVESSTSATTGDNNALLSIKSVEMKAGKTVRIVMAKNIQRRTYDSYAVGTIGSGIVVRKGTSAAEAESASPEKLDTVLMFLNTVYVNLDAAVSEGTFIHVTLDKDVVTEKDNVKKNAAGTGSTVVKPAVIPAFVGLYMEADSTRVELYFSEVLSGINTLRLTDPLVSNGPPGGAMVDNTSTNLITIGNIFNIYVSNEVPFGELVHVNIGAGKIGNITGLVDVTISDTTTTVNTIPPVLLPQKRIFSMDGKTITIRFTESLSAVNTDKIKVFTDDKDIPTMPNEISSAWIDQYDKHDVHVTLMRKTIAGQKARVVLEANAVTDANGGGIHPLMNLAATPDVVTTREVSGPVLLRVVPDTAGTKTVLLYFDEKILVSNSIDVTKFTLTVGTVDPPTTANAVTAAVLAGTTDGISAGELGYVVKLTLTDSLVAGHKVLVKIIDEDSGITDDGVPTKAEANTIGQLSEAL